MNEDDKKLMAYAQEIYNYYVRRGGAFQACNKCVFRGEQRLCVLNYPELKWDWDVFERFMEVKGNDSK